MIGHYFPSCNDNSFWDIFLTSRIICSNDENEEPRRFRQSKTVSMSVNFTPYLIGYRSIAICHTSARSLIYCKMWISLRNKTNFS